jgi:hypothetical protein
MDIGGGQQNPPRFLSWSGNCSTVRMTPGNRDKDHKKQRGVKKQLKIVNVKGRT